MLGFLHDVVRTEFFLMDLFPLEEDCGQVNLRKEMLFFFCIKYAKIRWNYNGGAFPFLCSAFFWEGAKILDKIFVLFF